MNRVSLKTKLVTIFLIPIVALFYFSLHFIEQKYDYLQDAKSYQLAANIINTSSKLLLNLQVERGLSAGYLALKSETLLRDKLLKQYKKTDLTLENFLFFLDEHNKNKKLIHSTIQIHGQNNIISAIQKIEKLDKIRDTVLLHNLTFKEEIKYYTSINDSIIETIEYLTIILNKHAKESTLIIYIQNIKEFAGLERAYIYHALLSQNNLPLYTQKIENFQQEQIEQTALYSLQASQKFLKIYNNYIDKTTIHKLAQLRSLYVSKKLQKGDALAWFNTSTFRINQLEIISNELLHYFIVSSQHMHKNAQQALYATGIIWVIFLIALIFLFSTLLQLIKKEEKSREDLRISSYTFNSFEAISITDKDANIIKVNAGFTTITGYTQEEVIGLNHRILKSFKHDKRFYTKMWKKIAQNGTWSGIIYNKRKNDEIYLERLTITAIKDADGEVTNYIGHFLDISDIQEAKSKALHQANHDFLTGIANRQKLMRKLQEEFVRAKRHNYVHAFLFIDIDNFKRINDSYGHAVGDSILQEVVHRLKQTIREEDFIARISGDEFAIILLDLDQNENEVDAAKKAKIITSKLLQEVSQSFIIDTQTLHVSLSIGIKLFPDSEYTAQDVIVHADTAMYKAKNLGKNQFVFFDKNIEADLKQLAIIEEEIKSGLQNHEFEMYYQAKVNIQTGKIVGAELLSRWNHPARGLLSPYHFIDIANSMGILSSFTTLALESACSFIQKNETVFIGSLAININSKELFNPHFESKIIDTINTYNINPQRIELEITEEELIKDFKLAIKKISKLQEFGVKFSIDDFGTGYSSITYLQQLPVNLLKIDKSFIDDISNSVNKSLLFLIIDMAKLLNMDVIIEGIETKEQLEFIQTTQARLYQGYYFSKPIKEEEYLQLLNK